MNRAQLQIIATAAETLRLCGYPVTAKSLEVIIRKENPYPIGRKNPS